MYITCYKCSYFQIIIKYFQISYNHLIQNNNNPNLIQLTIRIHSKYQQMSHFEEPVQQYQLTLNTFKEETVHKMMILEKIQFELNNKFRTKSYNNNQVNCQIVKFCRKNIQEIQRVLADIKSYFIDLNIQFAYDLVIGVFKILIMSFKGISERFVTALKDKKKQQQLCEQSQSFSKKTQRLMESLKNKNISEIQYFDGLIKNIELDQKRLDEMKKLAQRNIIFQKDSVQNINASDAVNQLETLKKHIDRIIIYSQKLGEEENMFKGQGNLQMKYLRKPQDIQQQYCLKISQSTKLTFVEKMQNIALHYYKKIREEERQLIIKQINSKKPELITNQTQTQLDAKYKSQNAKDKTVLILQNQQMRKINSNLRRQLSQLGGYAQKIQKQYKQLQNKNRITSQMLNKKMTQFQRYRTDLQFNLNKKEQNIQALNKKIAELKNPTTHQEVSHLQVDSCQNNIDNNNFQEDLDMFDDKLLHNNKISKFNSTNIQRPHHTSFFHKNKNQFKSHKQQNSHLRKSLSIVLNVLKQQNLILQQYPINAINNDLKLGLLIQKIEEISVQLTNKVSQIRQNTKQSQKQDKQNTINLTNKTKTNNKKNSKIQTQDASVQTAQLFKTNNKSTYNKKSFAYSNSHTQNQEEGQSKKENKLQLLKKQLLNRINSGKKQAPSTGRSRLFLHQIEALKNNNKITLQNIKSVIQRQTSFKQSKHKSNFNCKDISFQQFKINPHQIKSNLQKKITYKTKKNNNLKNSHNGKNQHGEATKRRFNNRTCGANQLLFQQFLEQESEDSNSMQIQGHQCLGEIRKLIYALQSNSQKKEQKDKNVKYFVRKLLQQLKLVKGNQFIYDILSIKHGQKSSKHIQNKNMMGSTLSP